MSIFDFFKRKETTDDISFGVARSGKWSRLRDTFLKGKECALCGGKKGLQAHHIKPFHLYPEDELNMDNLVALCEGKSTINCHLIFGHFGDFRSKWNPDILSDIKRWAEHIQQ